VIINCFVKGKELFLLTFSAIIIMIFLIFIRACPLATLRVGARFQVRGHKPWGRKAAKRAYKLAFLPPRPQRLLPLRAFHLSASRNPAENYFSTLILASTAVIEVGVPNKGFRSISAISGAAATKAETLATASAKSSSFTGCCPLAP